MKSDGFSLASEGHLTLMMLERIQLDNQPNYGEEKKK